MHVDDVTSPADTMYDMIIGTDLLSELGIILDFNEKTIKWEGNEVPMTPFTGQFQNYINEIYQDQLEPHIVKEALERTVKILDADYSAVNLSSIVKEYEHLNTSEQQKLIDSLEKYPSLFQGGLGTLNIKPIHLELVKDAQPYHAKPFPIPQVHEETTKKEIHRLESIGVLQKNTTSQWAAPTFIKRKKTGDVRILTDFRKLNMQLKRSPFPLPKISHLLQSLSGFQYATALDLSMGYYHVPLDEETQQLCTMILPWGKYQYMRLPMGIKNSPDIFQAVMNELLGDLEFVRVYLDDILIISKGSFDEHLEQLEQVLQHLKLAGFRVNVCKSSFATQEFEYLGFWLNRQGLQPQPKKVEAIMRLQPPKTVKQVRHFLGLVNYYRDVWRRRSHILAPLTDLTKKNKTFKWGSDEQTAFEKIKTIVSRETLLSFPDFTQMFHVYTDASKKQLGAVIIQNEKPIAYYSRKLNTAQQKYPTGEQELLSIVETLKEYRNILLGQKLIIHTDHKNLLYESTASDRVVRWRLMVEEYGPVFQHLAGETNIAADALSRLDADFETDYDNLTKPEHMAMAMISEGEWKETDFPLKPQVIAKCQKKDRWLKKTMTKSPVSYGTREIENTTVVTYKKKVYIPYRLQQRVVAWYHEYLVHPGQARMEAMIRQAFIWPRLTQTVKSFCQTCRQCQLYKKSRKKYGQLPPKEAESVPWKQVNVDVVGPFTVRTSNNKRHTLQALTMLDPVTGWFEIKDLKEVNSETTTEAFNNCWLSRYPRPQQIGFDNGSEFKKTFVELCHNYGIDRHPTTAHNPQANATIERIHQVLENSLRTLELEEQELEENNPWESILAACAWAIRSTYHTVLEATPGQLVFGRDMLLPIQFKADWARIRQRKQTQINTANLQENMQRIPHEYKVGDQVLLENYGIKAKLSPPRKGPYNITNVYTNGTVRIQRGAVSERVNLRRLTPYN